MPARPLFAWQYPTHNVTSHQPSDVPSVFPHRVLGCSALEGLVDKLAVCASAVDKEVADAAAAGSALPEQLHPCSFGVATALASLLLMANEGILCLGDQAAMRLLAAAGRLSLVVQPLIVRCLLAQQPLSAAVQGNLACHHLEGSSAAVAVMLRAADAAESRLPPRVRCAAAAASVRPAVLRQWLADVTGVATSMAEAFGELVG